LNGELDLGYTYAPAAARSGLASTLIAEEPLMIALPAQHRLAKGALRCAQLNGEAFIALPEKVSPQARRDLLAACRVCGFTPNIEIEAAEPLTVLNLVATGLGLAIVQASLRRPAIAGVVFRKLPRAFALKVQIFRVAPRLAMPHLKAFLSAQN
jgi:DNA-binding transcriptional LysR family regulator